MKLRPDSMFSLTALTLAAAAQAQTGGDMKGMDMKPSMQPSKAAATETATHQVDGVVKSIDTASGKVTLSHGPVQSLKWPAMTMAFPVKDKAALSNLKVGQKVHVELKKEGADYVVTSVK